VYVTARELEKSFIYEKIVEITSHMRFCKHIVDNACYISKDMRDRNASISKSDFQGH